MAVSSPEFAICFAGSVNRASVNRSGRPIPFARAGQWSGMTTIKNHVSSEARYTLTVAFGGFNRSCQGEKAAAQDRKSTRMNSSHPVISYGRFRLYNNTGKAKRD